MSQGSDDDGKRRQQNKRRRHGSREEENQDDGKKFPFEFHGIRSKFRKEIREKVFSVLQLPVSTGGNELSFSSLPPFPNSLFIRTEK